MPGKMVRGIVVVGRNLMGRNTISPRLRYLLRRKYIKIPSKFRLKKSKLNPSYRPKNPKVSIATKAKCNSNAQSFPNARAPSLLETKNISTTHQVVN